ncbi:DUF938 domain-containing protein [Prochlorococcus marinus]|uniref:SAM-dependent methyltransferase n=1 Tax=Prochlorococcus marinus XMU1408 TaxID=2213228 RepID=A0A318R4Y3_PROMR|nr:DUF938 domain-containing protein [Prochlorococcus marinus]MBW3042062.1 SAM-dependent methyltransferase [Prochlorococcus marinus str. XMU1408]PYE03180.1 SAM-dependent methyltransferase [Prochlorococcus marinus XMU1408]
MKPVSFDDRLNFPATLRNREYILSVLSNYIPDNGLILEIASGSGEHGVFFQKSFPSIIWQTSDPELIHRKSIVSWIDHYGLSLKMPKPLDIDVEKRPWPITNKLRDLIKGIVCINMIHISPWSCTKALFEESKNYMQKNNFLILYGPFFIKGIKTSLSNLNFDQSLKMQNPLWGIRPLSRVNNIASENGFELDKIIEMPANNVSVIFRLK